MTKSTSSERKAKKDTSPTVSLIRALIAGGAVFAVLILTLPLLLSYSESPESYITVACAVLVSLTAFSSAFAASAGSRRSFVLTAVVNALAIILILVCASLVFTKGDSEKNYMFSAMIYILTAVFSFAGAKTPSVKRKKKRTRR